MKLVSVTIQDCRNIESLSLQADEGLTVIAGKNGQGKTNLLECIWLLTGAKSFRGSKDKDLVKNGKEFGRIVGVTQAKTRENTIELLIAGSNSPKRGRSAKVNGVDYGRATGIAGIFTSVVFDPGHLTLVKGGPEGRRKFIDAALCQLYPRYIGTLRRFTRALSQKNALLKKYYQIPDADSLLDAFDAELSESGSEISRRRIEYLARAGPLAEGFYKEISNGAEELNIRYCSTGDPAELYSLLSSCRQRDIRAGFCTEGPHREDFESTLDGKNTRIFASQGQQRSAALSLKLAEAAYAKEVTGSHPVMLLDDVLSELDPERQSFLLHRMEGKQCFVTTCDPAAFERTAGMVISIQNGRMLYNK